VTNPVPEYLFFSRNYTRFLEEKTKIREANELSLQCSLCKNKTHQIPSTRRRRISAKAGARGRPHAASQ